MRRLVVNADDFGLTAGVNRGITEAHRAGIVTSTSFMAGGSAFEDAVALARRHPSMSVGCHVVLVDGEPLLRPAQVGSLLRPQRHVPEFSCRGAASFEGGSNPKFRNGFAEMAAQCLRGSLRAEEIEAEAAAQIRKLQAAGIAVSHVDTHKHVHMLPRVRDALLRAASACGVRAVRNPFTPLKPLLFADLARRPRLWMRYIAVKFLASMAQSFRTAVAKHGRLTTDGSFGVVVTGALDEQLFRAIVGSIPQGTWEFVCHPGSSDRGLDLIRTRLRASRETELRVFTSDMARAVVRQNGIELITYNQL